MIAWWGEFHCRVRAGSPGGRTNAGSLGGKRWVAFVRQDPPSPMPRLERLGGTGHGVWARVFAVLLLIGLTVARRIAPAPSVCCMRGFNESGSGRLDQQLELKTGEQIEQLARPSTRWPSICGYRFEQIEQRMEDVRRLEAATATLIEHSPEMIYQLNKARPVRACE